MGRSGCDARWPDNRLAQAPFSAITLPFRDANDQRRMHNRPPDSTKRSKARDYIWLDRHLQPPSHALCWHAAAEITLQHQDHADGCGYPKGLMEIEISPDALIISIVDATPISAPIKP